MVDSYIAKKGVTLVRNPHFREWSPAAQPDGFPDRIVSASAAPDAHVAAVLHGHADLASTSTRRRRRP